MPPSASGLHFQLFSNLNYFDPSTYLPLTTFPSATAAANLTGVAADLTSTATIASRSFYIMEQLYTGSYSLQLSGYFTPTASGNHTFTVTASDGACIWLGQSAAASPPAVAAALACASQGNSASGTMALAAGFHYPMLVQHAKNGYGWPILAVSCAPPGGSATFDGTGLYSQTVPRVSPPPPPFTRTSCLGSQATYGGVTINGVSGNTALATVGTSVSITYAGSDWNNVNSYCCGCTVVATLGVWGVGGSCAGLIGAGCGIYGSASYSFTPTAPGCYHVWMSSVWDYNCPSWEYLSPPGASMNAALAAVMVTAIGAVPPPAPQAPASPPPPPPSPPPPCAPAAPCSLALAPRMQLSAQWMV